MSKHPLIQELELDQLKSGLPTFSVGDTLKVHMRIIEGNKERIQVFTGVVIGRYGSGVSEMVSLYRVAFGCCVERKFFLHSPRVAKIERLSEGAVRRAKLTYLRGVKGKKARVRHKTTAKGSKASKQLFVASEEAQPPAEQL